MLDVMGQCIDLTVETIVNPLLLHLKGYHHVALDKVILRKGFSCSHIFYMNISNLASSSRSSEFDWGKVKTRTRATFFLRYKINCITYGPLRYIS